MAAIVADLLLCVALTYDRVLVRTLIPAFPFSVASVILATKTQSAARRAGDNLSLNIADAGLLFGALGFLVCSGLAFLLVILPRGLK
jgi:hypothetical protein